MTDMPIVPNFDDAASEGRGLSDKRCVGSGGFHQ